MTHGGQITNTFEAYANHPDLLAAALAIAAAVAVIGLALRWWRNRPIPWDRLPQLEETECPDCSAPLYLDLRFPLNQLRCRECGGIGLIPDVSDDLTARWRSR